MHVQASRNSYRVVMLLRLLRLLRLATILNKSPELSVIVAGFISAVNSVAYILLVLVIILYIYAILGFHLFHVNDPVRFGSVAMAMWTMLQVSTLSGWEEVLYTAQYGCDAYPGTLYASGPPVDQAVMHIDTSNGKLRAIRCVSPEAQPLVAALFFSSFTVVAAFIVLSLFVGIITLSMLEQMETHIRTKRQLGRALEFREQLQVSLGHAVRAESGFENTPGYRPQPVLCDEQQTSRAQLSCFIIPLSFFLSFSGD